MKFPIDCLKRFTAILAEKTKTKTEQTGVLELQKNVCALSKTVIYLFTHDIFIQVHYGAVYRPEGNVFLFLQT